MSDTSGPPKTPAEQRRVVLQGCQSVGGCLGIVVLLFAVSSGLEFILRRFSVSPAGDDVVIFASFGRVRNEMIGGTLFALVAMIAIPAFVKNLRASLIVAMVAAGGYLAVAWMVWYRPFAALVFKAPRTVELQYLWPRPNRKIDAATVVSFDRKRSLIPSVGSPVEVHQLIFVTADGEAHRSLSTRSESQLDAAQKAIERMGIGPR